MARRTSAARRKDPRRPSTPTRVRPTRTSPQAGAPTNALTLAQRALDAWIVPPDTAPQRKRGRGSGRRTETMAQPLADVVEQFCNFQRKQRGKTEGGVRTYRWILEQFLIFVRNRYGRLARRLRSHRADVQRSLAFRLARSLNSRSH